MQKILPYQSLGLQLFDFTLSNENAPCHSFVQNGFYEIMFLSKESQECQKNSIRDWGVETSFFNEYT